MLHSGDNAETRLVVHRIDATSVRANTSTVSGVVESSDGTPVEALVDANCSTDTDYFERFEPTVGGRFSVAVTSGECRLKARRGTLTTAKTAVTVEPGGIVDNVILTFREGRVVGRSVPGARVQLTEATPPGRVVATKADGQFAFEHVSPGDVQLTVTAEGSSTAIVVNGIVPPDGTFDAGDIQLPP